MQRRNCLTKVVATAATGGAILGAPAVIGQSPAVRCRLASSFPKSLNTIYGASNELYNELSAKNANWKEVYEDLVKFRADQNLWFRFTEARFNRVMQSQKL